jgi:hypothetical protein
MANVESYQLRMLKEAQRTLRDRATALTSSGPSNSPEQAAVIHDAGVIDKLSTKFQNEKPITLAEADSARIPEIREKLEDVYLTQRYGEKLATDRNKLSEAIDSLSAVSALAMQKADGMTSAAGNDSGPIRSSGKAVATKASSQIAIAKDATSPDSNESAHAASNPDEKTNPTKMLQAVASMKPVSSPSLRDRMKKKLAQARAAEDAKLATLQSAGGKDIFEGGLSKDGAAAANDPTKGAGASLAAQAVTSALLSSSAEQQRFTLAGAETDAAVQKLMRNPSGTELASNDASVLAANSLSLFERVRVAHAHCLKQRCVQAN